MSHHTIILAVFLTTGLAMPAMGACDPAGDALAAPKLLSAQSADGADIMISMTMMPKMMHIDYASLSRRKLSCDLGPFPVGSVGYELYGDDAAGRSRIALPSRKGDSIAEVVPVVNILKAIDASKQGKAAEIDGYLLATITKNDFTGWRYYTGIPDQATLVRDMGDALGGVSTPLFRDDTATGKASIFVTK